MEETEINVLDFLENSFFDENNTRERMGTREERGGKGMNGSREKSFLESLRMPVIKVSGLESQSVSFSIGRTSLTFDKTTLSSLAKHIEYLRGSLKRFRSQQNSIEIRRSVLSIF